MFKVPVSNGELIDKITILKIKKQKINNNDKLVHIENELNELNLYLDILLKKYDLNNLIKKLEDVNLKLWDIEDNIRIKEKKKEFDDEFIQIARSVYINNDKRCAIKLEINKLTKSFLVEVKSYEE